LTIPGRFLTQALSVLLNACVRLLSGEAAQLQGFALRPCHPQVFVRELFEWSTASAGFGLELARHVIIERQSLPHRSISPYVLACYQVIEHPA
jgi:hypothetical protein